MIEQLWTRVRDYFERLFPPKPAQPGRFVTGSKLSWRGWLGASLWVWPSRDYLLYVPSGYSRWKRRPLVVLLHGCKQTPEDFAAGTRIAAMADHHGWLVLLPRQTDKANPWRCWNWFDPRTSAGDGEAAIVAAQINAVRRTYRAHPRRVFAVGMSAGGALAATLGIRHRGLFAGIVVHSGLASGAASSALTALDVMIRGADTPYERTAAAARGSAAAKTPMLPLLAIRGGRDEVVADINVVQLVRQYLVFNDRLNASDRPPAELPSPDAETTVQLADGRSFIRIDYRDGERVIVRLIRVPDLGHAWSGGDAALSYNDPRLPDATGLLADFVVEQVRLQRMFGFGRK
ncbi:MAG: PHB depolymerase family esterase [Casimicrobiaceae bacterium]